MSTYQELDDVPAVRVVVRSALSVMVWIALVTMAILWVASLWRPLGVALLWLDVGAGVVMALKFTGLAPVDLLLTVIGYPGDRYDLAEPIASRAEVFARILEISCMAGSIAFLFHALHT
ncbi:MAG: hypothetical protein ABIR62_12045 [Dokdonella sp.]|uniref:hypothetical protein n=1 Tax=Dokdonella sp. TaxID=2291710 RepID=UPI0032669CCE